MRRTDPLIIGGGPAGAAVAIHLARAGARPLIVERQPEARNTLCGGFLSWRTLERLQALGIPKEALGGAEVRSLRIFLAGRPYEIRLPAPSMGLSRERLDAMLLKRALDEGAVVRHAAAREYADGAVRLDSGETLEGDSLFLATGKHDLRGLKRAPPAAGDPMLGLRLRPTISRRIEKAIEGHIEMHIFDGGYLGIVLQEDGLANACLAVSKSRLAKAGCPAALFQELAETQAVLGERLGDMPATPEIDAVGRIPYGWRAKSTSVGVFRLGDQAGVIASVTGEGIGIALASAERAAACWRSGGPSAAGAYQRAMARRLRLPLLAGGMMGALARQPEMARAPVAMLAGVEGLARLLARMTRIA